MNQSTEVKHTARCSFCGQSKEAHTSLPSYVAAPVCANYIASTEVKHTPTPWEVGQTVETSAGQKEIQIRSFTDGSNNGLYVGSVWSTNGEMVDPCAEGKANAAFIVLTANSHEELLKHLEHEHEGYIDETSSWAHHIKNNDDCDVCKAIAKAEARP